MVNTNETRNVKKKKKQQIKPQHKQNTPRNAFQTKKKNPVKQQKISSAVAI